jgi:Tol biopolymer transport system component
MNELRERFRTLDTLEVPDVLSRARSIGPRSPDPEPTPRVRRVGAYVLAAVIATLAVIAVARALDQPGRPADDPTPTPTPGSLGSLAYTVDGDIYVADWDGSNPVRIANGDPVSRVDDCNRVDYSIEGSIWSPDGRYLAYWRSSCDPNLWGNVIISDPEGNVIASFPGAGWQVSWSPDSTRVAVWIRWGETIGVYGLDGERQTVLTVPPGMMAPGDFDPVWLPDGESLLVPNAVEIPLDGSTPRRLPWADQASGWWATYSPDGSRVAYAAYRSLVVASADGSHPQEVFGDSVCCWYPAWSPTGDRIAFTSGNGTELRVLDVATETVTLLAETDGSDRLSVIEFSPEGDRILLARADDRGRGVTSLWSIDAEGSNLRRLVARTAWNTGDWQSLGPSR